MASGSVKANLGYVEIANNKSATITFPASTRWAAFFVSSYAGARGVSIHYVASSAIYSTKVNDFTGIAFSASGLTLTVSNTSGGIAYMYLMPMSGTYSFPTYTVS